MNCCSIENGRLVINVDGQIVKQFYTAEVFARSDQKPYVMLTESNGGKTIVGVDIFMACLEAAYNQFNFVTSTYNSSGNVYMQSQILESCVVKDNFIQQIINIIEESQ